MKKILLGLGGITAVVAPITVVVSCGNESGGAIDNHKINISISSLVNDQNYRIDLIERNNQLVNAADVNNFPVEYTLTNLSNQTQTFILSDTNPRSERLSAYNNMVAFAKVGANASQLQIIHNVFENDMYDPAGTGPMGLGINMFPAWKM